MKKFYMSALLLLAITPFAYAKVSNDTDRINESIESSEFDKTKRLLAKYLQAETDLEQKKKTLKELIELATDTAEERKEKMSVTANNWDLGKLLGGGFVGVTGTAYGAIKVLGRFMENPRGQHRDRDEEGPLAAYSKAGISLGLGVTGLYLAWKGYKCSAQEAVIKSAQKIEDLLEDKLRDLENPKAKKA